MKKIICLSLLASSFLFSAYVSKLNFGQREWDVQASDFSKKYRSGGLNIGTKVVASNLNVAWSISWGPDNWIWYTEQSGTVSKVNPETGEKKMLLKLPQVYRFRSLGLLGMAIHPDKKLPYVFLDYTVKEGTSISSMLVRYTYQTDTLVDPVVLLKDIPGATGHNGSRVIIAPDGKLMMTTGDATKRNNAQDPASINGKILRINIDGSIPVDNPWPGSAVWSIGHRNAQGLVFDNKGNLFSSEHGDAIDDELNLIKRGGNYGWPFVEGLCDTEKEKEFCKTNHVIEPLKAWTPVIAPAAIAYYDSPAIPEWRNSVLLVTLKTQSLRILKLNDLRNAVISEKVHLDHEYGRLRGVCVSPAGDIYVSTSNRDWNPSEGYPKKEDDRIIKIFKSSTPKIVVATKNKVNQPVKVKPKALAHPGAAIYNNYCASCHKSDAKGLAGLFPPLRGTPRVLGSSNNLLSAILKGVSGPITVKGQKYNSEMPAFNFLKDKEVAALASYIRSNFGNTATVVTEKDVANVRKAIK